MDKLKGYFDNREDALRQLILEIEENKLDNTLVLGISPDGAILAKGLAQHFGLPLEFLFLSALKAPENRDCVIALVSEKMDVFIHKQLIDSFGISTDEIYLQATKQYEQIIQPQTQKLRGGAPIQSFEGKHILIVDEGIETGFSMEIAIKTCINAHCKSASIATPVLPMDVESHLLKQCDCIYRVLSPKYFVSTNYYYKNLPILDEECFQGNIFSKIESRA